MESSSISVAVRVRPFSEKEAAQLSSTYNVGPALFGSDPSSSAASFTTPQPSRGSITGGLRKVLKVLDDRILVFDPPETNAVASFQRQNNYPVMGKKVKDIRFCFDKVFDEDCGQEEVYDGSAKALVSHVMNGFHSTVMAYGATGCGKTHTISGSPSQPGIVFLIMKDLFARIAAKSVDTEFSLTVSYLEIYNETIRDLLAPESGPLQLRESNGTATPAGLSSKEPTCATDVVEWITLGNQNRTVNATEANATSSRSHAVLSVTVTQKPKAGGMTDNTQTASLSVIDLAGSERASVTKNKGDRLIEGANINRSLLALGNCINALCDPRKRGHVPYRDSKLTRLLKQSLGGNCKTVMIVCVSPSSAHYDETHNTLQYANRAKEIKTKAVRNVISVDRHVGQYCQQILEQASRIKDLEGLLAKKETAGGVEQYEAGMKAVQLAKGKLVAPWEHGRDRLVNGERARIEKEGISNILRVLEEWRSSTFTSINDVDPAAAPTITLVRSGCDHLVASLSLSATRLASEIAAASSALDIYSAMVSSHMASIRTNHPQAAGQLQLETQVLDLRLETALGEARELGLLESNKVQARAMHSMFEARLKVGGALDAARVIDATNGGLQTLRLFAQTIDFANRAAFLALTDTNSLVGRKRDAGSRSPLEPESPWGGMLGRKAPRASVAGFGSAPTGSLASPMRPPTTFNRQSPRKAVSFKARRGDGTSGNGRGSASPKKRKEVQWRDEVGDGEAALEDFTATPDTSMDTPLDSASSLHPQPMLSLSAPANPWAATSLSITAAEKMAQSVKHRSATGSLRNRPSSARPALPSLAENGKPFSFTRESVATSARPALSDLANSSVSSNGSANESYSMAGPSGLFAPLVSSVQKPVEPDTPRRAAARARRTSQIGPQRSAVRSITSVKLEQS
ncbi:hypothetical protein P7C70_g3405, partial [Phenoliferia sp. Uapishka_3]